MKHVVLTALMALIFAPAAQAQTPATATPPQPAATAPSATVDANVQVLKAQLEGMLENQKAISLSNGCKLLTDGEITVEKANGYYAFTLPAMTYVNAGGARTVLGMLAINAVPAPDNINWKVSLAIPTPIKRFSSEDNSELVRTQIGAQNISGVWNTKLARFTTLNGSFKNVSQNFIAEKTVVTIDTLTASSKLTETKPGTWTGPVNVVADNMAAYNDKMKYKGIWPKITLATTVTDIARAQALTKDDIIKRPPTQYRDYYNIISLLAGEPKSINMAVTGFDDMVAKLQAAMLTAKQDNRSTFMGANILMAGLSALGQKDPANPAVKNYNVLFGDGGKITVNGVDLQAAIPSLQ